MKLLTHIQPQLDEMVNDLFFQGYQPSELTKPLRNTLYWWQDEIYRRIKVNADNAEMTFVGWMNAVEVLGLDVEAFNESLISVIESTIEYQWEVRLRELQEDMAHERELVLA